MAAFSPIPDFSPFFSRKKEKGQKAESGGIKNKMFHKSFTKLFVISFVIYDFFSQWNLHLNSYFSSKRQLPLLQHQFRAQASISNQEIRGNYWNTRTEELLKGKYLL